MTDSCGYIGTRVLLSSFTVLNFPQILWHTLAVCSVLIALLCASGGGLISVNVKQAWLVVLIGRMTGGSI